MKYIITISLVLINVISGICQETKITTNLNNQITGVYKAKDGSHRVINSENNYFFWKNSKGRKFKLHMESDEQYNFDYNNDHFLKPVFNSSGNIVSLILNNGNEYTYSKLDLPIPDEKVAKKISDNIFTSIIGQYKVKGVLKIDVTRNGDTLILDNKMMGPAKFFPKSEFKFFKVDEENVVVDFIADKKGNITGFNIDFVDEQMSAKKGSFKEKNLKTEKLAEGTMVTQIDHIVFMPEKPVEFFKFLSEELQLPVAWDYKNYGDFSCGGVSIGDVNIESYYNPNDSITTKSIITGIAFEPAISTEQLSQELSNKNIKHFVLPEYEEMWTNIILSDMLPGSQIFSCEYHFPKEAINYRRIEQKEKLEKVNGGSLGIEYVSEITIGVTDLEEYLYKWNKLLYPIESNKKNSFIFKNGLKIKLVNSDMNCIQSIRFKVKSIDKVISYLTNNEMIGESNKNFVSTNPDKFFGVLFEFEK